MSNGATAAFAGGSTETQLVPSMFVFGDSLVDVGNNNFLNSVAKSNFWPYGCDFSDGPTGRFSNGKTVVDFIDPTTVGAKLLKGVNYASAAAGILDDTGRHWGDRYSLSQQVINFESTLDQLNTTMSSSNSTANMSQHLAKSIAFMSFGSNDYINNYLLPSLYTTSSVYSPFDFANLLLNHYARQIIALHSLGLRKFFLAGIGPLGCIPNQRATGVAPAGRCVDYVNQMLGTFNEGLRSLVTQLNENHPGRYLCTGTATGQWVTSSTTQPTMASPWWTPGAADSGGTRDKSPAFPMSCHAPTVASMCSGIHFMLPRLSTPYLLVALSSVLPLIVTP
ncbi:hypothetical protein Dimus_006464 [Dionaea muscipula]